MATPQDMPAPSEDQDLPAISFASAAKLWLKIGFLSFGGAAGQIAMLHRILVEEKRWMSERSFLGALNLCMLLPGPEAQQLAIYAGWRLHGLTGGVVAGCLFVVPGAAIMLGLSLLYRAGQGHPVISALFMGVKAAVLAILVDAIVRIGRRVLTSIAIWPAPAAAFFGMLLFDVPFALIIAAIGLIGYAAGGQGKDGEATAVPFPIKAVVLCLAAWGLPIFVAATWLGPRHILVELGGFFSKLSVLSFGGAYAVLAWLAQSAVETKRWVTANEMLNGLGLAETTPGPTVLVNQFIGFLAASRSPEPFSPVLAGILGAFITTWATFAPSFLWIFAAAPFMERILGNRRLTGALRAISAAVVGIIAALAVRFAWGFLLPTVSKAEWGGMTIPVPEWADFHWDGALLSLAAGFSLFGLRLGVPRTVALSAAAGMLLIPLWTGWR